MSSDALARVRLVGLIAGGYSGVPRYAALLSRAVDRVAPEFPSLELSLLTTARGAERVSARNLEVVVPRGPAARANSGPGRLACEQLLARGGAADLLHFFDLTCPLLPGAPPFVTTAHDARAAWEGMRKRWAYKRRLQPLALRRAAAVVAVSQFTKDELVRHYGADPRRVHVIHSGPGLDLPAREREATEPDSRPYLLYLGALEPHKNLVFLLEAFERAHSPVDLILAGRPGSGFGRLRALVERSPNRHRVRIAQDVSDSEADHLYRNALSLVHPSLYEGFGFTLLEAMARNCPVLATDIPALREISGSGALLLPPRDVSAWADAICRIAGDDDLRAELRTRGARTVSRYSWDETARGVCRLFAATVAALRREQRVRRARSSRSS